MKPARDGTFETHPTEDRELVAGKYEVIEEIGTGAAGTAYKVRHAFLDSLLCLTVLPEQVTDDPAQLARLREAVRRASALRHEHIVPVLDFGQEGDRYYIVEALAEDESLDRIPRKRLGLGPAEVLHVARQLAAALDYAHERGVVHGAIAPACVRLQPGAPPRAMLSGFATAPVTVSCAYPIPERLAGKEVGPLGDVFALGLLLFEMLEGKPFFTGGEDEIGDVLLRGSGPLVPQFSGIMPTGVSRLVARAIRRSPGERLQGMAQVREEVDACLRRLGENSIGSSAASSASAPVRRRKVLVVDDALLEPTDEGDGGAESPEMEIPAPPVRPAAPSRAAAPAKIAAAASRPPLPRRSRRPRPGTWSQVLGVSATIATAVAVFVILRPTRLVDRMAPAAADQVSAVPEPPPTPPPAPSAVADRVAPASEPIAPVRAANDTVLAAERRAPLPPAPAARPEVERPTPPAPVAAEHPAPPPAPVVATERPLPVPPTGAARAEVADRAAEISQPPVRHEAAAVAKLAPTPPEPTPNLPPRITGYQPRRRSITVAEGGFVDFSARAVARFAPSRLFYSWFVDGRRVSRLPHWRFEAPRGTLPAAHTVEVRVSDQADLRARPVSWTVEVVPHPSR